MMEPAMSDLLTMSKNLESHELAKIRFTPERMSTLDELLSDTYARQSPKPIDYQKRLDLLRVFNTIAKEIYGHSNKSPIVEGYGSFVMDMFNEKSDLDMSINFVDSSAVGREKKISTLRKFIRKLYTIERTGHITSLSLVSTARVPIIKLTDRGTGIECDLSVENRDGIAKSHIIHAISAIDERFQRLCFLMKSWAQAHNINSSKDRTLNSLSIVSLVAFHLQTCNPPILPPFSALLRNGADPASVIEVVRSYLNYGKNNKDSLAKLFITLFAKLASVEQLWKNGLCVSLLQGSWVSKPWRRSYAIRIEDFTDRSQNVARAVRAAEFGTIYTCIHASLDYFMEYRNDRMQGKDLLGLLFRAAFDFTPGIGGTSTANHNMNNHLTLLDSMPSKKRHLEVEGLAQSQAKKQARQGAKPQEMAGMQRVGRTLVNNVHTSFTPLAFHQPPRGMGGMQHVGTTVVNNVPTSFTPLASRQPLLAIPNTNISVQHQGYGPRIAPPHLGGPPPPRLEGPHNLVRQPQPFPTQTSQSFVQFHHQDANGVFPTRYGASHTHLPPASHTHLPPASYNPYTGYHTSQNHRRY